MGTEKKLAQKIYAAVRLIPREKVASYSQEKNCHFIIFALLYN